VRDAPLDRARELGDSRALEAVSDEIEALHADLRALAAATSASDQAWRDEVLASQDEHAAALERQVTALRDEVGSRTPSSPDELAGLQREHEALRGDLNADLNAPPATGSIQLVPPNADGAPAARTAIADAPAAAPQAPRRSFLAFQLPSDDFRFDERRTWTVLRALSRVGFDARSTLHDFSGATSEVAGELTVDLAHPERDPRVLLRVDAAALVTGDARRDEGMREHLDVAEHHDLEFELTRFEPGAIDAGARAVEGTASGRLQVRGVARDVAMKVRLSIDDAQRLCVEGAMPLDLEEYGVPVPSKLGLISMQKDVVVWISLRLRVNPRTSG